MISFFEAILTSLSVHRVGNKTMDEFYVLSDKPTELNDLQRGWLMQYFLQPFEAVNEVFNFFHPGELTLNEVYQTVLPMLGNKSFHENSIEIAKILYNVSNHPKIKGGEVYIAQFSNIQYNGELVDAIGIFKSESRETYLKVNPVLEGFDLSFESDGINIHNLDKGCLILNRDYQHGLTVLTVDKNKKESSFWKDDFLGLKIVNNDFHKTGTVMNLCKSFITTKLDEDFEISKAAKAELLNDSLKYFKDKESFDIDEFSNEVFKNKEAVSSFKEFKSIYDEEFDANIPDSFEINSAAVKKGAKAFKAIIKLDGNFHIYVHGDKNLIEKGFDQDKSMNFYKVYFKEES